MEVFVHDRIRVAIFYVLGMALIASAGVAASLPDEEYVYTGFGICLVTTMFLMLWIIWPYVNPKVPHSRPRKIGK